MTLKLEFIAQIKTFHESWNHDDQSPGLHESSADLSINPAVTHLFSFHTSVSFQSR